MTIAAIVLSGLMLAAGAPAPEPQAGPAGLAATGETRMKVVNIWADEKGVSHFRDVEIDMGPFVAGGTISAPVGVKQVWYRIAPADQNADFHVAPRRQLVITLQGGTVEFTTSDGESRQVKPGEIVLVEDTFGQGHKTRTVDGKDRVGIFVSID